jgi:glycosyltransferase involved in cell wall biosynthesis
MSKYNILIEKEYYSLDLQDPEPIIGCLMMVKNEEERIHVSLESVANCVKCYIIYDTGSTDKTTDIIQNHCEKNKINLYMINGDFVNFAESRNVSLDYADTKNIHYLVLLDSNDELRGGDKLVDFAKKEMNSTKNAYMLQQSWWTGLCEDKYFNVRFIKPRKYWRYRGPVHEWIEDTAEIKGPIVHRIEENIVLYQDRTKDLNKSLKRFERDKEILLIEHKKDPVETRTLFYLAQTCACLNHVEDAFYYYKLRSKYEGFQEEKFHSFVACGDLSQRLNKKWDKSLGYYMKAINHSQRAEPMIKIAKYYNEQKNWLLAFTFANLACELSYPTESILFIDSTVYKYTRWHTLGIVAYYCGKYIEGQHGCKMAIEAGVNITLDKSNLEFYEKKLTE